MATTSLSTSVSLGKFVDINSLLTINSKPELVADLDAIQNSFYNLMNCPVGSLFWEPEYGSYLWHYLQEPCHPDTAYDIQVSLLQSFQRWEPRAQIDISRFSVTMNPAQTGYIIDISGTDRATGAGFSFQLQALKPAPSLTDTTI